MSGLAEVQREYLAFGKALLSGDTNFPEIPASVSRDLFDLFIERSVAARVFRFVTMGSESMRFYVKAGTVEVYAPVEGSPPPESKLVFGQPVLLEAREVRALSRISDVAEEESIIDLVAVTIEDMSRKFADVVDKNVIMGRGDGSDAYNLFTGLQRADTLLNSQTGVKDLAKAPLRVEDINEAVAYLEELGYRDDLVMIIHPRAAMHLRNDLAAKGLESISGDVLRTGEVNSLLGLSKILVTTSVEKRDYSATDPTKVSDVIICSPSDAGIGGYRRQLRIERDRDVEAGITKIAASMRFGWSIAKTDAIYLIKNALA